MSVSTISIEDAKALLRDLPFLGPRPHINFFATFGTSGCLLNCEAERTFELTLKEQKDSLNPKTRQHRKQIRSLRDECGYRSARQEWFDAKTINASVDRGCGSCYVLRTLVCTIFAKEERCLSGLYEYSISQSFYFRQRRVGGQEVLRHFQLFQPRGMLLSVSDPLYKLTKS
jgi:hypothetical protein